MKYGGGDRGEAETLQKGSQDVFRAQLELAKQTAEQSKESQESIKGGLGILAEEQRRKEGMAHQTAMQEREIAGRSALAAQEADQQREAQGHAAYLRGEAEPTGAAPTAPGQAGAAPGMQGPPTPRPQQLPGQVSTMKGSGAYAPTPATKEGAFQRSQLVGSEVYGNMAKVENQRKITETHIAQMNLETGIKRDEFERKAYDSHVKTNDELFKTEASAAEHLSFIDTKTDPAGQKVQTLTRIIEEARGRREAEGLMYAAQTGDVTFMIPGSKSDKEFQTWLDPARMVLNSSPTLQAIARRRGGLYTVKAVNRFAATLQMMGSRNPEMQQAAALAFIQEEQLKGGGGGGAPRAPGAGGQQPR